MTTARPNTPGWSGISSPPTPAHSCWFRCCAAACSDTRPGTGSSARAKKFDALLTEDIERRRAGPEDGRVDILSMLLAATYEDGSQIDDARAARGTPHTTGRRTRDHRDRGLLGVVRAAPPPRSPGTCDSHRAGAGPVSDAHELARLPYLDAVCNETLRLHPPVPIVLRRLTGPWQVRGVPVAEGTTVGIALPLLHSHPDVWQRPDEFDPDRFLDRRYSPFEFAPFGGAHRRCIGFALAEYEMRIVLATILARVRLALPERYRRRPPPVSVPHNIATGPRRPIMFEVLEPAGAVVPRSGRGHAVPRCRPGLDEREGRPRCGSPPTLTHPDIYRGAVGCQ